LTTPNNNDDALCLTVDEVGKVLYENCIPLSNGHPAASPEMAIRALKSAYELALSHYQAISDVDLCAVPDKWVSRLPMPNGAIQSIDLQRCEGTLEFDPKGGAFSGWLKHRPTDFETQKFDLAELQRWLEANGVVSSYRFDGVKADTNVPASAAILATATVGADGVVLQPAKTGPLPVTTRAMADSFAGLHWSGEQWIKKLGNKPVWLHVCMVANGARGKGMRQWNPVLIGAYLVRMKKIQTKTIRAKFQTQDALKPWLEDWKHYEAENFPID
jgi:hypothetical protein